MLVESLIFSDKRFFSSPWVIKYTISHIPPSLIKWLDMKKDTGNWQIQKNIFLDRELMYVRLYIYIRPKIWKKLIFFWKIKSWDTSAHLTIFGPKWTGSEPEVNWKRTGSEPEVNQKGSDGSGMQRNYRRTQNWLWNHVWWIQKSFLAVFWTFSFHTKIKTVLSCLHRYQTRIFWSFKI